ncbi:MAG TPA: PDZ domain-containing protein [Tepidisphaeraceae bacterium]|nr:PDZ domain-containing protein [Tepidisphaeraceae bacterium]
MPPRLFVPARDFLPSLQEPPTGQPLRIPWFGAQLTGPSKEVAEYFNLKNTPVVQVGVIIPGTPASKAGLQPNDKIIKLNGQALDRGDEPDETPRILMRKIRRMKVGQSVTLTILRAKDQPTTEVSVTLEEQPRQANLAKRFYADDLGLSVREAVFTDDYANRLPLDAKGVVVAYLRPGSSAATASLRPNDFIKELNSVPVEDLEHFKSQYQQFRRSNPKDVVVLVVLRDGITQVIKIEPPQ